MLWCMCSQLAITLSSVSEKSSTCTWLYTHVHIMWMFQKLISLVYTIIILRPIDGVSVRLSLEIECRPYLSGFANLPPLDKILVCLYDTLLMLYAMTVTIIWFAVPFSQMQFFIVIAQNVYALYTDCDYDKRVEWACTIYLSSLFILFMNFFIRSYIQRPQQKQKTEEIDVTELRLSSTGSKDNQHATPGVNGGLNLTNTKKDNWLPGYVHNCWLLFI